MADYSDRMEAAAAGARVYYGGKPCKYGHTGGRRVDSRACVQCYELGRGANRVTARLSARPSACVADALSKALKSAGMPETKALGDCFMELASMTECGYVSAAQLHAAIQTMPFQIDTALWCLTAAGRAVGRDAILSVTPNDAIAAGWLEPL